MIAFKKEVKPQKLDFVPLIRGANYIVLQPVIEVIEGLGSKRVPLIYCMLASLFLQIVLILGIDKALFNYWGLWSVYPRNELALVYRLMVIIFPLWVWGTYQVALKIRLIKRLTEIFTNSGLKTITGRLPGFIFDKPIDAFTRKMRLSHAGQSLDRFQKAKSNLESGLQVFIDEITENRKSGTVDIVYSHSQLEDMYTLKDVSQVYANSFLIGKGRSKALYGNLEDTPHLLVAGQTGMGKSTFLRQFITSLYLKNNTYSFDLIDLKGGLEFQIFDNLPRIHVKNNVQSALGILKNLADQVISSRSELLKLNGCKDIMAFQKLNKEERQLPNQSYQNINLDRHVVVVDEAFDLFMVGPHADTKDVKAARRHASKIAAQGRAVGVHIVIATQRPDRFAIDPQTKANLTGKVCFRLPNLASSMTVMDSKRAAELPNIKGRAIWQNSSDQFEVQTPFYSEEEAKKALSSFYKSQKPQQASSAPRSDNSEDHDFGVE